MFNDIIKYESNDCFRAAVYQHLPLGNYLTDRPQDICQKNLDVYHLIASKASEEVIFFLKETFFQDKYSYIE